MLERIIRAPSNEGDVVLDPFVGGGTTVVVADRLKRKWIGIDQSIQAIKVTEFWVNKYQGGAEGRQEILLGENEPGYLSSAVSLKEIYH